MQDINNCIKENDTDNVILRTFKGIMSYIMGLEYTDMSDEEIEQFVEENLTDNVNALGFVLQALADQKPKTMYTDGTYLYGKKGSTWKMDKDFLKGSFANHFLLITDLGIECYPITYGEDTNSDGSTYAYILFVSNGEIFKVYSSEYKPS